jgi:hypothetical protein
VWRAKKGLDLVFQIFLASFCCCYRESSHKIRNCHRLDGKRSYSSYSVYVVAINAFCKSSPSFTAARQNLCSFTRLCHMTHSLGVAWDSKAISFQFCSYRIVFRNKIRRACRLDKRLEISWLPGELSVSRNIRVMEPTLCTIYLQLIQSLHLYMFRAS